MLWEVLLAITIIWVIAFRWKNRKLLELSEQLKCRIKSYPVVGHAYMFIGSDEDRMKSFQIIGRDAIQQGGVTAVWMVHRLFLVVADPVIAESVLKTCLEKDDIMKFSKEAIGNGSVFAPVAIWRPRRKILAPNFNTRNLNLFVGVFSKQSDILAAQLRPAAGSGPFSVWKYLTTYSMDSVCDEKQDHFKTLLELLIESSGGDQGYNNLELREETMVLIIAGTDTSAVGAAFTTVMLSKHPDVQEKVYEEIKEVLGNSIKPITAENLARLKYLDAVVKESLRLYPPVPVIVRKVLEDVTLPSGLTIHKGCGLLINLWAIHRNPHYWGADAELFRPERFLDTALQHPAQFMPFSYGPRNCVGHRYAMMSMKTALATLLQHYRVLPAALGAGSGHAHSAPDKDKPLRVKFNVMMKHVDDYEVQLEFRDKM